MGREGSFWYTEQMAGSIQSTVFKWKYRLFLKPFFFMQDPEKVHDRMIYFGSVLGRFGLSRWLLSATFNYKNEVLSQNLLGIDFINPIGLAAGFDKNAELGAVLPSVGFGFMEVGSVTGEKCLGNTKPRLWRLKKSKSLLVHYGLKNDGCEAISKKLENERMIIPRGVSVAMTNCKENIDPAKAVLDYEKAFKIMEPVASYLTVNISCPNALGGQPFVEPANLEKLLVELDKINTEKPVFIKLSPDMELVEIDALLDVLRSNRVQGIICTNLTKNRKNDKILDERVPSSGGLSGKPVQDLSDKLLAHIYKREGKRFVLIGCGGVFSAEDAYKKIRLGASLVQLITGMIYEGPQLIGDINRGMAEMLRRDGFKNIAEAVGIDNPSI